MSNVLKLMGVGIGAALVACQSLPPSDASLEEARRALADARGRAVVARAAPLELEAAHQALTRAEKARSDDRDDAEIRHLAFLASQRVAVALHRGAEREAQERLQHLSRELARLENEAGSRAASPVASTDGSGESAHDEVATSFPVSDPDSAATPGVPAVPGPSASISFEQALMPLQARPTPRGLAVNLPHTLFQPRSATLAPDADAQAARVARALMQWPEQRVLIEAFTADTGEAAAHLQLSQARAAAFASALERHGLAPARHEARGLGAAYPVADNATRAGQLRNERLEVLFFRGPGEAPPR